MGTSTETITDISEISKFRKSSSNPDSEIPVADFIRYIEAVEKIYSEGPTSPFPQDTPQDILTRIRQEYYPGDAIFPMAFDFLIPDAPIVLHFGLEAIRRKISIPSPATALPPLKKEDPNAYKHLIAKADENAKQDNPSPYIIGPNQEKIDLGHALLGLDALLHPRTSNPFLAFGIPNIDPASWIADLALAVYWTQTRGDGAPKVYVGEDSSPGGHQKSFDIYYYMSAPDEDLFGDADSFGLFEQWNAKPGQRLSEVLRGYYFGISPLRPLVKQRWRIFCKANNLNYTVLGLKIAWSPNLSTFAPPLIARIDRMCDLFEAGKGSIFVGAVSSAPSKKSWPDSGFAFSTFLDWLKIRLEDELRNP
jgi:hypothetical protein